MKINKHLLTLLFSFLLLGSAFSQQISFNKLYFPDSLVSGGAAILTKGNGYLMQATENDSLNRLLFIELDSIGNQIKIVKFSVDTTNYYCGYGSLIQTHDNGYCFVDDIETPTIMQHYMIRFDSNMDTLWTRTYYHETIWQCVMQVCETTDKGFVMVGEKDMSSTITNVLIIKTDSLGNKLWEKTIATGGLSRGWQKRNS